MRTYKGWLCTVGASYCSIGMSEHGQGCLKMQAKLHNVQKCYYVENMLQLQPGTQKLLSKYNISYYPY